MFILRCVSNSFAWNEGVENNYRMVDKGAPKGNVSFIKLVEAGTSERQNRNDARVFIALLTIRASRFTCVFTANFAALVCVYANSIFRSIY